MEALPEDTVNARINELVNFFSQGNKSAFAKAIGISNQSLGEIVGRRQSAPSFAALQKIFVAFPQVRMQWLILGHGQMLEKEKPLRPTSGGTRKKKDFMHLLTRPTDASLADWGASYVDRMNSSQSIHNNPASVYSVADKSLNAHERALLSERLAVSEKEAERLVLSGEIKSKRISDEEGFRVTEQWVLDFMTGPSIE